MFGHDGTSYLIDFDLAVRLFQTFSNHIFTVGTRGGGYIYSISGPLSPLPTQKPISFVDRLSFAEDEPLSPLMTQKPMSVADAEDGPLSSDDSEVNLLC